ncbi:MAG TPA: superinfection immunity protein [Polyangia bacterium]|nr:superinfection immunity protein [Polyangia bacterium]
MLAASSSSSSTGIAILLVILYFLPTIIATTRKTTNAGSVFTLNLLLGWTIIGWWMALGLASSGAATRHKPHEPTRLTAEEWAALDVRPPEPRRVDRGGF